MSFIKHMSSFKKSFKNATVYRLYCELEKCRQYESVIQYIGSLSLLRLYVKLLLLVILSSLTAITELIFCSSNITPVKRGMSEQANGGFPDRQVLTKSIR